MQNIRNYELYAKYFTFFIARHVTLLSHDVKCGSIQGLNWLLLLLNRLICLMCLTVFWGMISQYSNSDRFYNPWVVARQSTLKSSNFVLSSYHQKKTRKFQSKFKKKNNYKGHKRITSQTVRWKKRTSNPNLTVMRAVSSFYKHLSDIIKRSQTMVSNLR